MIGKILLGCLGVFLVIPSAQADLIPFILTGSAGNGLLEGNINPPTGEVGTGGVGSGGIIYNSNTNILSVHVEWGSANGYTDLSSAVVALHLHGPTPSSGDAAFGETAPLIEVLSNSTSFNSSASGGGVNGNFFINTVHVQPLLEGRTYINVHLAPGDGGAIRGYMRAVPEPGCLLPLFMFSAIAAQRRRRSLDPTKAA